MDISFSSSLCLGKWTFTVFRFDEIFPSKLVKPPSRLRTKPIRDITPIRLNLLNFNISDEGHWDGVLGDSPSSCNNSCLISLVVFRRWFDGISLDSIRPGWICNKSRDVNTESMVTIVTFQNRKETFVEDGNRHIYQYGWNLNVSMSRTYSLNYCSGS